MATVVSGFVLLEVAFAILIFGVIGTLGLAGYRAVCEHRAYSVTEQKIERVFYALASYVKRTGSLPCPASVESNGVSVDQGGVGCSPNIGAVPYATLNMSERDTQDGWQRPITYAMDAALMNQQQISSQPNLPILELFCTTESQGLTIIHDVSKPVSSASPAVVLISHGPIGPNAQNPSKAYNLAGSSSFVDQSSDSAFDDVVRFVSRDNLLAFYGQSSCPAQ